MLRETPETKASKVRAGTQAGSWKPKLEQRALRTMLTGLFFRLTVTFL